MAAYCDLRGVCIMHCVRVYPHTARKTCAGLKDCVKFNSSYPQMFNFFLLTALRFFQQSWIICRRFRATVIIFFSCWQNEANTHIKTLLTNFVSFIKPCLYIVYPFHPHYFIKKVPLKNISLVITVVMFTKHFCFGTLHSRYLNFVVVTLFLWSTHGTNSLTLYRPAFVVSCVRYVYLDKPVW